MRTTLEIDDDVLEAAREMARLKKQGIGRAISDLARRGLVPETSPTVELRDGIPVWTHKPGAIAVTSEMLRNLADDE
ncbi:MAG: type II toxin-antitoxin system VapB family antitoxin [Acidobacteriota bacterium]|nr:type II toxin-antitoxin system VapB family antitoxin [Acidobacteriota bacterium]